jgi:hemolysin activation/secretion protein
MRPFVCILAAIAGLTAVSASAQTAPIRDEGKQLLEQERAREREDRLLQAPSKEQGVQGAPAVDAANPDDVADTEPMFAIERIALQGNTLLSQRQVRKLVAPFIGKRLGVNRINLLLRHLTRAYVDAGYVTTRVYVGRQNLASGTLQVSVVEGKIEDVHLNGTKPPSERGLKLAFPTWRDKTLRLQDLEQGVDQINRLPSNNAELQIAPGDTPGSSIVNINNEPQRRLRGVIGADDYGQSTTGQGRVRLGLEAEHLLGFYESYGITYVGSRDTNAVLMSSSVPFGYNTFSYNYYYSEFVNVIGDSALLFGQSQGHTFAWNRVLDRGASGKSTLDVSVGLRESRRDVNDIELTPQRLTVLRVGANRLQRFSRGFVLVDGGVATGLDGLGATTDPSGLPRDAAHAQYVKLDASVSGTLQLTGRVALSTQLAGQYTDRGLFSSEQIFIGGASTVRGFAEGLLSGDRGVMVRNEVQYNVSTLSWSGAPVRLQAFAFFDSGSVELIAANKWQSLASTGIGLRGSGKRLSAELVLGKPLYWPDAVEPASLRAHATINYQFF